MPEIEPGVRPDLVEGLCAMCLRKAYVADGADMACPVCSSPLLSIDGAGPEAV